MLGEPSCAGLAQSVRTELFWNTRLHAHLAKPIAEPGSAEWLAVLCDEKRQMLSLGHRIDRGLQLGQDRDVHGRSCFAAPKRKRAALNMLPAQPHHIAAGLHGPI
jgi:hypothetical protein